MEKMKRTILFLTLVIWLLIPTGTPDDIITFYLIGLLGRQAYIVLLSIMIYLIWKYKINFQKVNQAVKEVFR